MRKSPHFSVAAPLVRDPDRSVRLRNRHFLLGDALFLTLACGAAFTLRFEGLGWLPEYHRIATIYLAVTIPLRILVFYSLGLYQRVWQHASIAETERLLVAGLIGGIGAAIIGTLVLPALGISSTRIPVSVAGVDAL